MVKGIKGQRTKGNTKPSSSGRAAQLLAQSSAAVSTFVGFSAINSKRENSIEDEELVLDADLKVVLKKMLKKDCVTKIKALQQFMQLCSDKSDEDIKSVLPHWPRLYNKLAVDYDYRVREATHKSHEQLCIKVGRNIAPYLKNVIAIWHTSRFDCYSPAASAANSSFDTAFPSYKQSDVLLFCKNVIIEYITGILLEEDSQSISDNSSATPQELQMKYNRLVSNCLQGLTSLIVSLPENSLADCEQAFSNLLNCNKFWKLAKNNDSLIKSSWYKLMSGFAQHIPNLLLSNAPKICPLTLACLDESDPSVASALWECALFVIVIIKDSWKHVNYKKAFYPQFKCILREGGRGNASSLFPNLLPLISRIPHDSTDDFIMFYNKFFSFLQEGLNKSLSKRSECNAIIKAYLECFRYCISLSPSIEKEEQRHLFLKNLLNDQLLPMVSDSLTGNEVISKSHLYKEISDLWLYLKKEESSIKYYSDLLDMISNSFIAICSLKINECNLIALPRISRLLLNLFCELNGNEEDRKIRFRRESDNDLSKSVQIIKLNKLLLDERAIKLINELTINVINNYHSDTSKSYLLKLLLDLTKLHTNKTLAQSLGYDIFDFIDKFWCNYLKIWIEKEKLSLSSNEKFENITTIIDIIFQIISLSNEKTEKFKILEELLFLYDPYILNCLILKISQSNEYTLKFLL